MTESVPLSSSHFRRHPAVEASALNDEMMLFHPSTGKFCLLNNTSTAIWSELDGKARSAAQVTAALAEKFDDVSEDEVRRDVESVLREMLSLEIVVVGDPT
jgi:PqqD family protein of HPr-rel-A system